jgi:hypothetical protein
VNDIFILRSLINLLRNREVVGEIFGDMTNGPHLSGSTSVVVVTMNTGDAATMKTSSTFSSIERQHL